MHTLLKDSGVKREEMRKRQQLRKEKTKHLKWE